MTFSFRRKCFYKPIKKKTTLNHGSVHHQSGQSQLEGALPPLQLTQKESQVLPCPFPLSENTTCPFHHCHIHLRLNRSHRKRPQYCGALYCQYPSKGAQINAHYEKRFFFHLHFVKSVCSGGKLRWLLIAISSTLLISYSTELMHYSWAWLTNSPIMCQGTKRRGQRQQMDIVVTLT